MATIVEDYVSFETAKLLKEKGFLKGVDLRLILNLAFYDNIGLQYNVAKWYDSLIQDKIDFVVAPTHQMAMKWLREVHNRFIEVQTDKGYDFKNIVFRPAIYDEDLYCLWESDNYKSYEEACEVAIKYCLENLI